MTGEEKDELIQVLQKQLAEKDKLIQELHKQVAHARREANDHSLQLNRMHAFCDDRHGPWRSNSAGLWRPTGSLCGPSRRMIWSWQP